MSGRIEKSLTGCMVLAALAAVVLLIIAIVLTQGIFS